MKFYCKFCEHEIESTHLCYEVGDGYIHEDCIDEYIDELWDRLSSRDKRDLLNISNGLVCGVKEEQEKRMLDI